MRVLLSDDDTDLTIAGPLLSMLGQQIRWIASGDVGAPITVRLRRLGELLTDEGRSLSG